MDGAGGHRQVNQGGASRRQNRFARAVAWRFALGLDGSHWRSRSGTMMVSAYAESISRRLPPLCAMLVLGLASIILRFVETRPWIELLPGVALSLWSLERGWHWLPARVRNRSVAQRRKDLLNLPHMVGIIILPTVLWALWLFWTGNPPQRALVQVLLSVLSVAGVMGLAHAPAAALRGVLTTVIPASVVYLAADGWAALPVVLVLLVVNATAMLVSLGYHDDFVRLELSRAQLSRREQLAGQLARANAEQASRDVLTGGFNRRAILARLDEELARGHARPGWLALIDLDGFKHVNDTYGHAAGDAVICEIARRIGAIPGVIAHGRLGGDEFAILLAGRLDEGEVMSAAGLLGDAVRAPIEHEGVLLRLNASTGIHRLSGSDLGPCLERADAALYKAKRRGDGAIEMFGAEDEIELGRRATLTRCFNDCALDARLHLLYQPFYDVDSGELQGFEAFARWSPDGETWLSPDAFMDLADATGRTGELTRKVIERALAECDAWKQGLTLAVNLTTRDVTRPGVVDTLASLVRAAGADPSHLLLEMTEKALLADPRRALAQMQAFRAAGFRLALDDFGAGWSSLSQLRDLPFDMIKIDRVLASALTTDPGARAIVGTIVTLAWQLGIDCLIEGIESDAQAATARALGIRLMQGYHFNRPEPAGIAMASAGRAVA